MAHWANWVNGWSMVLAAFVIGAVVGLGFAREEFMGGYTSWRRRLVRLGHIALAALGLFNVVYGMAAVPAGGTWMATGASAGLIAGGWLMPTVCFLAAWRVGFKGLFFVPVTCLVGAVGCVLIGSFG